MGGGRAFYCKGSSKYQNSLESGFWNHEILSVDSRCLLKWAQRQTHENENVMQTARMRIEGVLRAETDHIRNMFTFASSFFVDSRVT